MITVYEFCWILIHVNSTSKYIQTEQLHALQLSTGGLYMHDPDILFALNS